MIQIDVERMAGKELVVRAKQFINEIDVRFKELAKDYDYLEKEYKGLKEKYKDLTQEESEPQYDYEAYNEGIKKGEQLMQEKVNKLCECWNNNKTATIIELFGGMTWEQIFGDIEKAYDKVIEYENEKEEIHVGDEVVDKTGKKYVVRRVDDGYIYLLARNGDTFMLGYSNASKTGKHYCLDEILKELE